MNTIVDRERPGLEKNRKPSILIRALILALTCCLAAPLFGLAASPDETEDFSSENEEVDSAISPYLRDSSLVRSLIGNLGNHRRPKDPPPPQLPKKFRWTGRYVVSDLVDPRTGKMGIEVPFVWYAQDGNVQMIAGGPNDPIFFTNFIYKDHLYTATFRWPGLWWWQRSPFVDVKPLFKLSLADFNAFLKSSRYAGPEILQQKSLRYVHHFRTSLVVPPLPSGSYLRFPVLIADFYSDQKDPNKLWQVLHFGFQNLFDPELDEWIIIDKMETRGGQLILPPRTIDPPP